MADNMKKVLTEKTPHMIQELDQEGCVTALDLGVRSVFFAFILFMIVYKRCAN
jgi:hypothetical protein